MVGEDGEAQVASRVVVDFELEISAALALVTSLADPTHSQVPLHMHVHLEKNAVLGKVCDRQPPSMSAIEALYIFDEHKYVSVWPLRTTITCAY